MNDAVNIFPRAAWVEILFFAVLIFLAMRLTHNALDYFQKRYGATPLIHRFFPMVEGGVWFLFAVWVIHHGFQAGPQGVLIVLVLGSGLLIWAARFTLSDWTAGVIFRGEDRYKLEDRVRFNDVEGRIVHFGYRSLTLETPDGRIIEIPYGTLVKETHLEKYPGRKACAGFTLTVHSKEPFQEIEAELRALALSAPWTTISQSPVISLVKRTEETCTVDVTVHLIDKSYAADLGAFMENHLVRPDRASIEGM